MTPPPATVAALLSHARDRGVARIDAMALLAHHWNKPHAWLIAHDDQAMPEAVADSAMRSLVERAAGMPLAYLVGHKEFFGLRLEVVPDVLIPRPETEGLVEWALEILQRDHAREPSPVVVDLGTGSGAIALAIKHACPRAQVHAIDTSDAALTVAAANARRLGIAIQAHRGDWWGGGWTNRLEGPIAVAVSNPPYVCEGDPHLPALRHEPRGALVAGADGLDAIGSIVREAPVFLAPGSALLVEHGLDQGAQVRRLMRSSGLIEVDTRTDLAGHERLSGGVVARS